MGIQEVILFPWSEVIEPKVRRQKRSASLYRDQKQAAHTTRAGKGKIARLRARRRVR